MIDIYSDLADIYRKDGEYAKAMDNHKKSFAIAQEAEFPKAVAKIGFKIVMLAHEYANLDFNSTKETCENAITVFQSLNEPKEEATAWNYLGMAYLTNKDLAQAELAFRESARITEELGDVTSAGNAWNCLAMATEEQGKLELAESCYRKAIASFKVSGVKISEVKGLRNLANLLQKNILRLNEAQQLAEEVLAIQKSMDESNAEIWKTYGLLAEIYTKLENNTQAKEYRRCSRDSYLNSSVMPSEIFQAGEYISSIVEVLGNTELQAELETTSLPFPDNFNNILKFIKKHLNGECSEEDLYDPLNYMDAAIVHTILQAIKNPEALAHSTHNPHEDNTMNNLTDVIKSICNHLEFLGYEIEQPEDNDLILLPYHSNVV